MPELNLPNTYVVFDPKPEAVPYTFRISYKIPLICLILRLLGRDAGCSMIELSFITSALVFNIRMQRILSFIDDPVKFPLEIYETIASDAVPLTISCGFATRSSHGKYQLTSSGQSLADEIIASGSVMTLQIERIKLLAEKLSPEKFKDIMDAWGPKNVKA
jgi:hypothetical protein